MNGLGPLVLKHTHVNITNNRGRMIIEGGVMMGLTYDRGIVIGLTN